VAVGDGGHALEVGLLLERVQEPHHREWTIVARADEINDLLAIMACQYFPVQDSGMIVAQHHHCPRVYQLSLGGNHIRPEGGRTVRCQGDDVGPFLVQQELDVFPVAVGQVNIAPPDLREAARMVCDHLDERRMGIHGALVQVP